MSILQRYRNVLLNGQDEIYLAKSGAIEKVQWQKEGKSHTLIKRSTDNNPNVLKAKALLSCVMQISSDNMRVQPDAGWTKKVDWPLHKASMSLMAHPVAKDTDLKEDGWTVLNTIQRLEQQIHRSQGKSSIIQSIEGEKFLRFKHSLFVEKKAETADDRDTRQLVGIATKDWPTTHEDAAQQLPETAKDFEVRPLPLYNLDQSIIMPWDYAATLENAIVEIQFTVSHWNISTKKEDAFTGNIVGMYVIEKGFPDQHSATPKRKRRIIPEASNDKAAGQPPPTKQPRLLSENGDGNKASDEENHQVNDHVAANINKDNARGNQESNANVEAKVNKDDDEGNHEPKEKAPASTHGQSARKLRH